MGSGFSSVLPSPLRHYQEILLDAESVGVILVERVDDD
jgi:hypothetical protein